MRRIIFVLLLALASPAAAQNPTQLDSLRTEAVRSRAFIRGAETQLSKVIDLIERLTADSSVVPPIEPDPDPEPPDTILPEPGVPPDSTQPPEDLPPPPVDARAFVIGPQVPLGASPWPYFDQMMEADLVKWAGRYLNDQTGGDTYYDLAWALYQLHARSGDSTHLALARAVAEKYWTGLGVSTGWTANPNEFSVAPRSLSAAGLILYALEGGGAERQTFVNRQDSTWSAQYNLWEWLEGWARAQYPSWLGRRLQNEKLWAGLRDGSMLLTAITQLAAAHPKAEVRADFRQMALDAAVQYYARLQWPDGSWRWDPGQDQFFDATQPFQGALTLEALTSVHRLTGDSTVLAALIAGGEAWYRDQFDQNAAIPHVPDARIRGAFYISYGGVCDPPVPPNAPTCGNMIETASGPWQARNKIMVIRHRNTFAPMPLAYVYHVTGDERFRDWAIDVFSATYAGEGGGTGADGLSAIMPGQKGKEVNQLFRTAAQALAYLSGQ